MTLVAETVRRWQADALGQARIVTIGIAVPGLVRAVDGVVRNAPHLEWRDVPLAAQMVQATGIRTVVDNDATLGAVAEHRYLADALGTAEDAVVAAELAFAELLANPVRVPGDLDSDPLHSRG